jgi:hypothetical protein
MRRGGFDCPDRAHSAELTTISAVLGMILDSGIVE